jgi:hypothetical protein
VHRKRPEHWPNGWILHHDNAPAHKALSCQAVSVQKSITEVECPPISSNLAPADFWLLAKIKSALMGQRFQDIEHIQKKKWQWH